MKLQPYDRNLTRGTEDLDFTALIEAMPDFVCFKDGTGRWVKANDAALKFFQLEHVPYQGKTDLELAECSPFYKKVLITFVESDQRAWDARTMIMGEEIVSAADGEPIIYAIRKIPLFHQDGSRRVLIVLGHDITQLKHKEEEYRSIKEELESLIHNTTDSILLLDRDYKVIRVNKGFEQMFGWTAEEIVGKQIPSIPDFLTESMDQTFKLVFAGAHVSGVESVRKRKDGTLVDVSITISPIRNERGEIIALAGISRDITERKRVEQALRNSEMQYRLITENMSDLIIVMDANGQIHYASPSHHAVLGISSALVEGQSIWQLVHPEDIDIIQDLLSCQSCLKAPFQAELRMKHANGDWITVEVHANPICSHLGAVEQIVLVARDVRERKKMEELLRKSDKLSIVGQLAAGVAHEIRNPLTALKGFAQLLESQITEHKDYLQIMLSELNRIELIVNEFLFLAKPQASYFQQTDLQDLLLNIVALLGSQAILHNVQIITEFDSDTAIIECEENQIKQVFINVLKNAMEAMPNGGNIVVQLAVHDVDQVVIRFIDQGCGIPEEQIPRLGEPFYTTKAKGTGLGLMISQKIIENHQGTFHIHSQVGIGTTVEIYLPIRVKPFPV